MKGKNLPVLFLYKNKKRGDLVNVWAMGWGWGSLLRSDSLARCEKQKDKRLWTDYSRLDIMHHLRYDGAYRLSLFMELSQGVDVNLMPCMFSEHVRVLSRIYRLGEKSRVAEGHELPRGVRGMLPLKFFEMNMRWDATWYILRPNFEKCYSGILFYFSVVITFWQCYT